MNHAHTAAEARQVRAEDAIDVVAVDAWLRSQVPDLPPGEPDLKQFPGGASNLTFLLSYGGTSSPPDPTRDIVVRMPPRGTKAASAHNMSREYEVQRRLRPHFPYVPAMLAFTDAADSPTGSEMYAMERAEGVIFRADLSLPVTSQQAHDLGDALFDLLAQLHAVDVSAAGLREFYRGPGYVERQISGWSKRYRAARTDDVPNAEDVMAWLAAHQPDDVAACLVHGDWRFDNVVIDPTDLRIVAVLDWELATVGDPLMDLGAALAYWVQADDDPAFQAFRRQPSNAPGMPTRADIVARYSHITGRPVPNWTFYEVYGLFRLAVIVQQIWYRYRKGQTSNPAFAAFGPAVTYLIGRCERVIAAA